MKVVAPLSVESVAVLLDGANELRIVEITLTNHHHVSPQLIGLLVHSLGNLLEQVRGAEIEDTVHRVEPQSVDVILRHPMNRVVNYVAAHFVAVRVVVIERGSPRRLVLLREVRTVQREIIPLWPKVVVHDLEYDSEALGVCGV